jgi:hypothetical protein
MFSRGRSWREDVRWYCVESPLDIAEPGSEVALGPGCNLRVPGARVARQLIRDELAAAHVLQAVGQGRVFASRIAWTGT